MNCVVAAVRYSGNDNSDYNHDDSLMNVTLNNSTLTTTSSPPTCHSYGEWPTNEPRVGPVRGFLSNDHDITFQSCVNSTRGSDHHFVFYTRGIIDHRNVCVITYLLTYCSTAFIRVCLCVYISVCRHRT